MLEFRIDYGPGFRIYFGREGGQLVILLAGGTKRRQDADIAAAKARWKDYKARKARVEGKWIMALTRAFKETVQARAAADPAFKLALLTESLNALLEGDLDTGKAVLRDYINATVGFEVLAKATGTPSKSLMRMLSPRGNPSASNLFAVLRQVQVISGVTLQVHAA